MDTDSDPPQGCWSCGGGFLPSLLASGGPGEQPPGLCIERGFDGEFDYGCVMGAALQFFESQMTGPLPADIKQRVPWRGDTLLNDAAPNSAPLLRGW